MRKLAAVFAALGTVFGQSSANVFMADFDTGTDGFSAKGFDLTHESAGGVEGGFISLYDSVGGDGQLHLDTSLVGPLRAGGSVRFDAINLGTNDSHHQKFGSIKLAGAGYEARYDGVPVGPKVADWTSFVVPLTADRWGLPEEDFASLLQNLDQFTMVLEIKRGLGERIGIDNFWMTDLFDLESEVPAPGALVLFVSVAGFYAWKRRAQGTHPCQSV